LVIATCKKIAEKKQQQQQQKQKQDKREFFPVSVFGYASNSDRKMVRHKSASECVNLKVKRRKVSRKRASTRLTP
jgi:hypothetical protein